MFTAAPVTKLFSPTRTSSDYWWRWHPNLQAKVSLRKCHTFVPNLRVIQQNFSHHSTHQNSTDSSIRHRSNLRSRKCSWCMLLQIPECPCLHPISNFQDLRDLSMFNLCVRLWHLEEERPFETAPRTTRLPTQQKILHFRAPRFARCFTSDVSAVRSSVDVIGRAELVAHKHRPIGRRHERSTCTSRRGEFERRRRRAPAESHVFALFLSKVGTQGTSVGSEELEARRGS